jgi:PAS domain-containing protein
MPPSADFILRHTSDAVLVVDASWRVTTANLRAETLLLRDAPALLGATLAECIADFAGSRAEEQLRGVRDGTFERRVDHFSPSRYSWYEIRAVPNGDSLVLFLRDVSDRVRQTRSEAVREAVRQLVNEAPVAISITRGAEHRYELVNSMSRRLIGGRDVEGRTARMAFPEIDESLFAVLDEVYRTGKPFTARDLEVAFDRDGSGTLTSGTFDVTYQPLFEADGTVSGILSVSVETTPYVEERRRLSARDEGK